MPEAKMSLFFSRHTILSGYVDYYCLVCENRFMTLEDTIKHIITDAHQQQLAITLYESKDDGIKKIKLWYYCEFCSVVLKTKAKVRLHIIETQHVANKTDQLIKRYANVIIAFDDVQIDNKAWNGLCDSTCIICNNEYEDVSEHLKDAIHHINFMQSNIEFNNKNIYRVVDETSFHCLTCNSQEALPVSTHFDSPQHKSLYKKCQVLAAKIINDQKGEKTSLSKENELQKKVDISVGKEKTIHLNNQRDLQPQIENVKINVAKSLAETKDTKESVMKDKKSVTPEIVNNTVQTSARLKENNNISIYNMKEEEENICKVLHSNDYITEDEKGAMWCILCNWVMDSHNKNIHINSTHHINILELHKLRIKKFNNLENENSTSVEQNKALNMPYVDMEKESIQKNSNLLDSVQRYEKLENDAPQENTTLHSIPVLLNKPEKSSPESKQVNNTEEKPHLPDNKLSILDALERFQNNHININFENMIVACRKCSTTVDFDYKSIEEHIGQHKERTKKDGKESGSKEDSSPTQLSTNTACGHDTNHSKILDSLKKFQKNYININFETKKVTCKKCFTNIDFDYNIIESHIAYHKNIPKDKQKGKQETGTPLKDKTPKINEEENYANRNNFKILPDQKLVSCEICKTQVSLSLKDMKDHIHTNTHKSQVEADRTKIETISIDTFIQSLVSVKNSSFEDHIINNQICINILSFIFITRKQVNVFKCLCCDLYLGQDKLTLHVYTKPHLDVLNDTKLVTNVKDEFIRQLPSNRYHCGFCNILVNCWQDMTSHLNTISHEHCKTSAKYRLHAYGTSINGYEGEVSIESRFFSENVLKLTFSEQ